MNVRCEGNTESVREVMCTSNVSKCLCSSLGAILGPRLCASRKCNRMFNISASMLYSTSSNEDTRELFLALCAPPTSTASGSSLSPPLPPSPIAAAGTGDTRLRAGDDNAAFIRAASRPRFVHPQSLRPWPSHAAGADNVEAFGRLPHRADAQIPSQRLPPTVLDFTRPRPFRRPRA